MHALLHYQDERSDKEYELWLYERDDQWHVDYANARRGAAMTRKLKASNLTEDEARKVYDKTLKEKLGKGYKMIGGENKQAPAMERERVDIPIALLVPTENPGPYLDDPHFLMQEKVDGERRILVYENEPYGVNRQGFKVPVPAHWHAEEFCVIDGEIVGGTLHAFDLLKLADENLRNEPFKKRYALLSEMALGFEGIEVVPCAPPDQIHAVFHAMKEAGCEGVVFKHRLAPYKAGRSDQYLKFKFYDTASVIVARQNIQRSVVMRLANGTEIGSVTIPANHEVPTPGTVIEVRYLYAYLGGSLFQPVYLGARGDIDPSECTADQLKYK